jgi:hypothetical protein
MLCVALVYVFFSFFSIYRYHNIHFGGDGTVVYLVHPCECPLSERFNTPIKKLYIISIFSDLPRVFGEGYMTPKTEWGIQLPSSCSNLMNSSE